MMTAFCISRADPVPKHTGLAQGECQERSDCIERDKSIRNAVENDQQK